MTLIIIVYHCAVLSFTSYLPAAGVARIVTLLP